MRKLHFMLQKNTILVNCVGKKLGKGLGRGKRSKECEGGGERGKGKERGYQHILATLIHSIIGLTYPIKYLY